MSNLRRGGGMKRNAHVISNLDFTTRIIVKILLKLKKHLVHYLP